MKEDCSEPLVEFEIRLQHRPVPWRSIWRFAARWALRIAVLVVVVTLLQRTGTALSPFVLGLLLAYVLLPLVPHRYTSRLMADSGGAVNRRSRPRWRWKKLLTDHEAVRVEQQEQPAPF